MSKLPARAGSRAQYVFWMIIAVVAVSWGMVQLQSPDGSTYWGLIAIIGFTGMAMRESSLRRKWKAENK